MEMMQRNRIRIPVLVHDDSSAEDLKPVCQKYKCELQSTIYRHGHFAGDVKSLYNGLLWAENKKLDILVKMSRRFIPLFDWTTSLFATIEKSKHSIYGNRCEHFRFPLRTECAAYDVKDWLKNLEALQQVINKNRDYVEHDVFNITKDLGIWEEIGNNRMRKMPNIMWHDCWSEQEYMQELNKFRKTLPLVPNTVVAQPAIPKFL